MAAESIQQDSGICHVYGIVVDGTIRYVGLSYRPMRRLKEHIRDARARPGGLIGPKLANCVKMNARIEVEILASCRTRREAAAVEQIEIAKRGGHTARGRQLWNTHRGGIGGSSEGSNAVLVRKWRFDPAFRERMSRAASRQIAEQRKDPAFEQRRIRSVSARSRTPEHLEMLARARMNIDRDRQRAAVSASTKRMWQDPEYRARMIAAVKNAAALRKVSKANDK